MGRAPNQLSSRLTRLRQERGISQRKLALRSGLSHGYISLIEKGDRQPTVETIRVLAEVLDVDSHYLETGDAEGTYVYVTTARRHG